MSIPEPPTVEQPVVGCPYCAAPLRPGQDWCLNCGAAVTTQLAGASGWRTPIAIVGIVLALAAAALVFAFLQVSDDADRQVAQGPGTTPTPAPAIPGVVTPVPGATPGVTPIPGVATPATTPIPGVATPAPLPSAAPTPFPTVNPVPSPAATTSGPIGSVASWPTGTTAYTIILLSGKNKAAAEKKAKEFADQGLNTGVLNSSDYSSLRPGYWVVFSGQYDTREAAKTAADGIRDKAPQAYPRQIKK